MHSCLVKTAGLVQMYSPEAVNGAPPDTMMTPCGAVNTQTHTINEQEAVRASHFISYKNVSNS